MDRILYMAFAAWTFVIALTMLLIYQRELEALQEQVYDSMENRYVIEGRDVVECLPFCCAHG